MTDIFKKKRELGIISKDLTISMSYLELYNEKIFNLLPLEDPDPLAKENGLSIKENAGTIFVENLSWHLINNYSEFSALYNKGVKQRKVGETKLNRLSSRSHAILSLIIERTNGDKRYTSKIHLIDLAGSEDNRYVSSYSLLSLLFTLSCTLPYLCVSISFILFRLRMLEWS